MRDLDEVMTKVLSLVPAADPRKDELGVAIADIRESLGFTAPEAMPLRWRQFCECLARLFPAIDTEWQREISRVVENRA